MSQKLFQNKKIIENELKKLLGDLKNSSSSLDDLVWEDFYNETGKYNGLFEQIYRNTYISSHYDLEALIQILDFTYQQQNWKTVSELVINYANNIKNLLYNEWAIIFPMEYATYGKYQKFKGVKIIGEFRLISPRRNFNRFNSSLTKTYQTPDISQELFEHQNRMNDEFLLKSPLLTFQLHGSRDIVRYKSLKYFRFYKWMQDLFIANFDKRSHLFYAADSNRHYFLLNIKNGDLERYPLLEGSKIYWRFDKDKIDEFRKNDFSYYVDLIFGPQNNKLYNRLYNSLYFFSKGFNQHDSISRFIFYVIAMESIFSRDKHTPIRSTLADYISLLCYKKSKRLEIHKLIRQIYDLRSGIVHSGKNNISDEEVEQAENIAAKALLESLRLFRSLGSSPQTEDIFFQKLLEMKLN